MKIGGGNGLREAGAEEYLLSLLSLSLKLRPFRQLESAFPVVLRRGRFLVPLPDDVHTLWS